MAEKAAELTIFIRARDLAKDVLNKVGNQLRTQLDLVRRYQNEIRAASKAALAIGVVGVTLFAGAIVQAADFEKQMSNVSAVTKANIEDQKKVT